MLAKVISKLRNSYMVYHLDVSFKDVGFCSKLLDLLWKENLIRGYHNLGDGNLKVLLRYHEGAPICTRLIILSRPRDRIYLSAVDLYRVSSTLGVLIVSTPKGLVTADRAVRQGQGGEVLAYIA